MHIALKLFVQLYTKICMQNKRVFIVTISAEYQRLPPLLL